MITFNKDVTSIKKPIETCNYRNRLTMKNKVIEYIHAYAQFRTCSETFESRTGTDGERWGGRGGFYSCYGLYATLSQGKI